jgi:hypothetical protein
LDSVSSERTFWQNATALIMSLIPSFVLLAAPILAIPFVLAGILFILSRHRKKKELSNFQ